MTALGEVGVVPERNITPALALGEPWSEVSRATTSTSPAGRGSETK